MIEFMIDLGLQTQTASACLKHPSGGYSVFWFNVSHNMEPNSAKSELLQRISRCYGRQKRCLTKAIIPTATVLHCLFQQAKRYLLQICPCPHNILRDATCFGHCGSRRSHPVASQSCYRKAPSERTQTSTFWANSKQCLETLKQLSKQIAFDVLLSILNYQLFTCCYFICLILVKIRHKQHDTSWWWFFSQESLNLRWCPAWKVPSSWWKESIVRP